MKKLLLIGLLIVGCEELGINTENVADGTSVTDTLYVFNYDTLIFTNYDTTIVNNYDTTIVFDTLVVNYDTTITIMDTVFIETESNIIEREFVIIKHLSAGSSATIPSPMSPLFPTPDCTTDNPADCAGECGGDAVEQTYYYDYDGDGLGNNEISYVYCSASVDEDSDWVLNSDDDDDTKAICDIFYTFNISDEDLETTDGNISFTYNEEDYLIDVSSCIEIDSDKVTRIIQDTELKVVHAFGENGLGMPFNYSSPNELLFVK